LQFRLFTGLLSPTPNWGRTKGQGEPEGDDDISDDDSVMDDADHPHVSAPSATDAKQGDNGDDMDTFDDKGDDRINAFLNDLETSVKIFLSSFMIKQGLIW
jgi:hypothetical protein